MLDDPKERRALAQALEVTFENSLLYPKLLSSNSKDTQIPELKFDKLLDSPHYGERWARHWLDVVRYADYHDADAGARNPVCEPLHLAQFAVMGEVYAREILGHPRPRVGVLKMRSNDRSSSGVVTTRK